MPLNRYRVIDSFDLTKNMEPTFFKKPSEFRKWLDKNHDREKELWVGFYKKASKIPSITWPESVDEALCYGWIDGIRKSIDDVSYKIRFTPRRPTSIWSAVNIERMEELKSLGLVKAPGLAAFDERQVERSKIYTYERANVVLDQEYEKKIKANKKAWAFFEALAPSYKKNSIHWVMSAKKEETRLRRLEILIKSSEEGQKIPQLRKKK